MSYGLGLIGILVWIVVIMIIVSRLEGRSARDSKTSPATASKPNADKDAHALHPRRNQGADSGKRQIFSHTRLEQYEKCPKAFEYHYIRRVPEDFATIELFLGRSIHSVLEWAYKQRDARSSVPSVKELERTFDQMWSEGTRDEMVVVKRGKSAAWYKNLGRQLLQGTWQRVLVPDKSETLALEKRFEIELDGGQLYTGVIDRVARGADGKIQLIDFKTGSSRYIKPPQTSRQLRSYSLWAFDEFDVEDVELCVEDLQGDRGLRHPLNHAEQGKISAALLRDITKVQKARSYPAKPSVLCGWCGYRMKCAEGRSHWGR